ncbi:MAG: hypothetical protein AABX11_04440 [Nanoarchaeota archaeon]
MTTRIKTIPSNLLYISGFSGEFFAAELGDYIRYQTHPGYNSPARTFRLSEPPRLFDTSLTYAYQELDEARSTFSGLSVLEVIRNDYRFNPNFEFYKGHGVVVGDQGTNGFFKKNSLPNGLARTDTISMREARFFPVTFVELSDKDFKYALKNEFFKMQTENEAIGYVKEHLDLAKKYEEKRARVLGVITTNDTLEKLSIEGGK